ncbi:MAG: aspartyl/glutamyl-tRNA amidotransferase subunit C [Acidilobaceae archaeon]
MDKTGCDEALVRKLAEIAKLELNDNEIKQICRDVEKIASYLKGVSEAASLALEPLYHVWEEIGHLREPAEDPEKAVDVRRLSSIVDERGYIKSPWRGGRIVDFN